MGMLPESLIGLDRTVSLGRIGPLARMRDPRTSTVASAPMPYATLRSLLQGSGSRQGPPNERLKIRHGHFCSRPLTTESWSRPTDRLETTLAVTACMHSVQYVGALRLPDTDLPRASG